MQAACQGKPTKEVLPAAKQAKPPAPGAAPKQLEASATPPAVKPSKVELPALTPKFDKPDESSSPFPYPIKQGSNYVYRVRNAKTKRPKVWSQASYFIPSGYAVASTNKELVLLNRSLKVQGQPFIFDNFPDAVQEGFIRLKEKGKVRYFSVKTGKTLKGAWDAGTPFLEGIACVCNNCKKKDGEYTTIVGGGQGWVINTQGKVLQTWPEMMGGFPGKCPLQPGPSAKEWRFP